MTLMPTRPTDTILHELARLAAEQDPLHQRGVRELQLGLRACEQAVTELVPASLEAAGWTLSPPREPQQPLMGSAAARALQFDVDKAIATAFGRLDARLLGARRFVVRADVLARVTAALPEIVAKFLPSLRSVEERTVHAGAVQKAYIERLGPGTWVSDDDRAISERMAEYRRTFHRFFSSHDVAENAFTHLLQQVKSMSPAAAAMWLDDSGAVDLFVAALEPNAKRRGVLAPKQLRASSSQDAIDPVASAFPGAAPNPTKVRYR